MSENPVRYEPSLHATSPFARMVRIPIDRMAPLRMIVKSGFALIFIYTARVARAVTSLLTFLGAQISGPELNEVIVPDSGIRVFLRRRLGDFVMCHQIIGRDTYGLPVEVKASIGDPNGPLHKADLGANIGPFTVTVAGRYPAVKSTYHRS